MNHSTPKPGIALRDDLLQSASEQLDRILGFFPRVDAKGSALLAIDTAMLGFLAAKIPPPTGLSWWEIAIPLVAALLIAESLYNLYKGAFPQLKGGHGSLIYFREIGKRTEARFIDEFGSRTEEEHVSDLLGQVWRNSEILKDKFDRLNRAFIFLALSIPPWVAALVIFTIKSAAAKGNP